jgi:diguanylate cyclase (GGDEF)-like protein/PAS domain S-box-containing protein
VDSETYGHYELFREAESLLNGESRHCYYGTGGIAQTGYGTNPIRIRAWLQPCRIPYEWKRGSKPRPIKIFIPIAGFPQPAAQSFPAFRRWSPRKRLCMLLLWLSLLLAGLAGVVIYQQFRIYEIHRISRKKEELFQIVTENAADMIALVDVHGRRLYNSPAYKRILGYSAAELGETSSFEQIHPDDRFKVLEAAREATKTGVGKRLDYRIKHKDGSWRVLESLASTIRDENGEVAKLVIVNRDITERRRAEEQLEHNLFHDPLTGLPNRRLFLDRLQHSFVRSRRDSGRPYTLVLLNVDHFKVFNDTMGMGAGDHVLLEIGRRLGSYLRQEDKIARRESGRLTAEAVLFRLGGDEFVILFDAVGDASDAMRVAQDMQAGVAEPFFVESHEVRVSMSIGIALSTVTHERPEEVLKDADVAMRRAKALGGSRCEIFDEAMHTRAVGRLRLESDLREAMAEHQFRVYYQPVVHLATRRIASFEALLRWDHPSQGMISPYRFIEAAEDSGILVSIGHWLMLQACRQLREWDTSNYAEQAVSITVNVSARQFAGAGLVGDIQKTLQDSGIAPARLQLEITESVAAADPKLTVSVLSHLKQLGIGVILDDFGTGTTSLRGLRQFPVDALKIDRSLVREMQADRTAGDIVELIATLAQKMGLRTIAEGIENARQMERLRELGCEYGQGYYFSQPMEAKAVLQFMQQQGVPAQARSAAK